MVDQNKNVQHDQIFDHDASLTSQPDTGDLVLPHISLTNITGRLRISLQRSNCVFLSFSVNISNQRQPDPNPLIDLQETLI